MDTGLHLCYPPHKGDGWKAEEEDGVLRLPCTLPDDHDLTEVS